MEKFDRETWNPEKSGRRWKTCMCGRCFESASRQKRGLSECWDGQLIECGERASQEQGIMCVCCSLGDLEMVVWRDGCSGFMRERERGENSGNSSRRNSAGLSERWFVHVPRSPIFT